MVKSTMQKAILNMVNKVCMLLGMLLVMACESDRSASAPKLAAPQQVYVVDAMMYEPAPGQKHGAIYLKVVNPTAQAREVVDIATSVSGSSMIHRTYYEEGQMKMRHVNHMTIEPNSQLVFEPKGYHVMVMDLDNVPAVGETFSAELALDQSQIVSFDVEVKRQH